MREIDRHRGRVVIIIDEVGFAAEAGAIQLLQRDVQFPIGRLAGATP